MYRPDSMSPGHDGADEQLADGLLGDDGEENRQNRGWNQYTERAARQVGTTGNRRVIHPLDHRWQGDHPHGDFRRADDAAHRGEDGGCDNRAHRQAAAQGTEDLVDHVEQFLDDPGPLEH